MVDTRVPSQVKLVIWLMGDNQGRFERIASYGYHGMQSHYSNGWFAGLTMTNARTVAAQGSGKSASKQPREGISPADSIPNPDGMMERALDFVMWLAKENPGEKSERFLTEDGGGLRWEKVVISGILHGSSTAARFAVHQKAARVTTPKPGRTEPAPRR